LTSPLHDYYEIAVWDSNGGRPDTGESLVGHFGWIGALAFSPDSSLLASGATDHGIKIWDPYQRRVLSENRAHRGRVHDLAFSPDGTQLVSGSADHQVRLWNVPDLATAPPTDWPFSEPVPKIERLQATLEALLAPHSERATMALVSRPRSNSPTLC
jgi:WD40 repeat protein